MQINLNYTRLHGVPLTVYQEDRILDDGLHLKTYAPITLERRQSFAELWWKASLIPQGHFIASLTKHYFYNQWFDILELHGDDGQVLGYYSDICTPLKKIGEGQYATTDLILDLWLSPSGLVKELDWDEYDHALQHNLITPELATQAKIILQRLASEAKQGYYPFAYLT